MSPVTTRSTSAWSTSSATSRAPQSTAHAASSFVIAGPARRSAVPSRTRARSSRGCAGTPDAMPTSSTVTLAPTVRPRALTAARSAQNSPTMIAVTSFDQAETPCASTPWSPAHTTAAGRSGTGGGQAPWTAASHAPTSSSRPRLPGGLTSWSLRARAAAAASVSSGPIAATSLRTPSSALTREAAVSAVPHPTRRSVRHVRAARRPCSEASPSGTQYGRAVV